MGPSTLVVFTLSAVSRFLVFNRETTRRYNPASFLTDTLINRCVANLIRGEADATGDPSLWTEHDWHPVDQHPHQPLIGYRQLKVARSANRTRPSLIT